MEETGFFVKYGDCFYSPAFETLKEAREDARLKGHEKKYQIFHGNLKRINDHIINDSQLSLIPRIGGYET